jgi:AsmA protein
LGAKTTPRAGNTSPAGGASAMRIGTVSISGGRITVTSNSSTPLILDKVSIDTKGISSSSALPFSLTASLEGGGTLQVTGSEGPLNQSDTAATPVQATVHITHLDLAKSGLIDKSAGIGGIANLDATMSQTGDVVRLDGTLKADQWKVATNGSPAKRPLEFDFTINHDRKQQAGDLTRGDLHLGSGLAKLTGHYDLHGTIPVIDLSLAAPNFPGTDVAAALPAMDVVLPTGTSVDGGTVSANLRSTGPVDKMVSSGTVAVANARLSNFDLGSKLRVLQTLSGVKASPHTEIQTLRANVQSTPAITSLDGIQLVVPSLGEITGAGTVSASHALDFKMRIALTKAVGLIPALGRVNDLPFSIQGTSQDPKFVPNAGAIVDGELKKIAGGSPAAQSVINGIFGRKH